ncbi:uncharacterized protein LOC124668112 [Lolium rigidum]|uniref:uncharacterized protein LOC124668112 n=1 Tax=Lolium rigidum TaxID=89674 RepID=UPI001F5DE16F|nr:uncharacterized protein LOC124668112 [Lolium rigidum]
MPQVDLESLVCGATAAGAGDRKVSCETVIAGSSGDASPRWVPPPQPPPDHDFPPESITIRIGDDDGAAFSELNPIYERDDSTKGSTNPKFAGACSSNPVPLKARSNSARIAGAPAAAATTFFGLPVKIRPAFTRRQPSQGRILPDKRSGGAGEEPRSPKVSCIGKVLSDRERYGRRRQRRWWRGVVSAFRCSGGCAYRGVGGAGKKMALEDDEYDGEEEEPSVAAMRRFKSGRRADTWAQEAMAAVAAASGETTAEEEKKHETEHWARLPVS